MNKPRFFAINSLDLIAKYSENLDSYYVDADELEKNLRQVLKNIQHEDIGFRHLVDQITVRSTLDETTKEMK